MYMYCNPQNIYTCSINEKQKILDDEKLRWQNRKGNRNITLFCDAEGASRSHGLNRSIRKAVGGWVGFRMALQLKVLVKPWPPEFDPWGPRKHGRREQTL